MTKTIVPVQVSNRTVSVETHINGFTTVALLLDTGAEVTMLKPDLIRQLGVTVPADAVQWPMTVVGGNTVNMPFVRLKSLRFGAFTVADIDVGVYDAMPKNAEIHGILGSNFLNHFKVTIDHRQGQAPSTPRSIPSALSV